MYVSATLKCPDMGEWLALTQVDANGKTESAGYIDECDLRAIAPLLRAHIEHVEEHGGDEEETRAYLAATALLHHIEVVLTNASG